ncbi:ABC transporter ATP-binding protein [Pseudorhodoplanes sp.]|uniref:ABC transporter ATP-binding protein n=1 Tax=Pseudorhodoplanes sp. TaxID=1934341 RepID=UPI003D0E933D
MAGVKRVNTRPRAILRVEDLSFSFRREGISTLVLDGVSFDVYPGELLCLVGPSGVGKSTALRAIAGLARPDRGNVVLETFPQDGARDFGFVFQDPRLLPWRRVVANVEYGLEGLLRSKAERRERAMQALELVGLRDKARNWPYQLSGGQKQRIGLARALALHPALLLMDEPFSALDPATRHGLQDELLAIKAKSRTAIVFVTHDMDEATYLADRILLLGGQPASIVRQIRIDTAHPRQRRVQASEAADASLEAELHRFFKDGTNTKRKDVSSDN